MRGRLSGRGNFDARPTGSGDYGFGGGSFEGPREVTSHNYNEDLELQRALEESKRTAAEDQKKRMEAQKR